MKRAFLLLFPALILVFLAMAGCNDESQPTFTRIWVLPSCGVAPLQVECMARVSGGNESGDPTGGNNNLEISWNFGDNTPAGQSSIAYHTFDQAGEFLVTATATDPDGKVGKATYQVIVMADTLNIEALSNIPEGAVATTDTVQFNVWAEACDIDPADENDFVKMAYKWEIENIEGTHHELFHGRQPKYSFPSAGDYEVRLTVTYPELAVVRRDTLTFTVLEP